MHTIRGSWTFLQLDKLRPTPEIARRRVSLRAREGARIFVEVIVECLEFRHYSIVEESANNSRAVIYKYLVEFLCNAALSSRERYKFDSSYSRQLRSQQMFL